MLSLFVDDNQSNWDNLLPYVMLAYRSSIHASTGFTPYKVLFGREVVLPVDVMLDLDSGEKFASVNEYVSRMADTLSTVVPAVQRHQARASQQQKTNFDFRANFQYYSVGERVWVSNKAKKRGICPKLQRRYKGPFVVLERVSEVLYRVALAEGGPDTVIHFNRLKPFISHVTERSDGNPGTGRASPQPSEPWYPRAGGRPSPSTGPPERTDHPEVSGGATPLEAVQSGGTSSQEGGTADSTLVAVRPAAPSVPHPAPGRGLEDPPGPVRGPGPLGQQGQDGRPVRQKRPPVWARDYSHY